MQLSMSHGRKQSMVHILKGKAIWTCHLGFFVQNAGPCQVPVTGSISHPTACLWEQNSRSTQFYLNWFWLCWCDISAHSDVKPLPVCGRQQALACSPPIAVLESFDDRQLWGATAAPRQPAALTRHRISYAVNTAHSFLLAHVQRGKQEWESTCNRERYKLKMWEGTESISLLLAQLQLQLSKFLLCITSSTCRTESCFPCLRTHEEVQARKSFSHLTLKITFHPVSYMVPIHLQKQRCRNNRLAQHALYTPKYAQKSLQSALLSVHRSRQKIKKP